MCGIVGFAGWRESAERSEQLLRRMCGTIHHRGPDDEGRLVAPGIALGMRRLRIIDLDGGAQPIGNEDGTVQVVFNGEIYNYRELREQLQRRGHRFRTDSDTEVLVHLYEEHGADLVHSLRGMFAFALWDAARERLLLARDRLGIKPLYYWPGERRLAFASELKALRALDGFPSEIDARALAYYLALGYVPDPECIYRGVRKLEPGHTLLWHAADGVTTSRYWSPVVPENTAVTEQEAVVEIQRLLSESVRYRLMADVPLGAFLSGGIDSSTVVAEMGRQLDRPVQTFTIGFDEPRYNEAPHAAEIARALGTEHHSMTVRPDVDALIESVVSAFDEPFADSSALPTYLVSMLAREHVTVALSGDGGDELFGGYTRYLDFERRNVDLPRPLRHLIGAAARRLPHGARGRNRLLELARGPRGRYAGMVAYALPTAEGGVARDAVADAGAELDELLAPWFGAAAGRDLTTQLTLVDIQSYLPGDILTKVDRMSMAASLEARVPLLDHHMVEFAVSLPASFKVRHGTGKWILRQAIRGLVPDAVLNHPKRGFGVPLDLWFRRELRHRLESLLRPGGPIHEFVDPGAVARAIREHLSGRREHTALLWRLIVLDLWLGQSSASPAALPARAQTLAH